MCCSTQKVTSDVSTYYSFNRAAGHLDLPSKFGCSWLIQKYTHETCLDEYIIFCGLSSIVMCSSILNVPQSSSQHHAELWWSDC